MVFLGHLPCCDRIQAPKTKSRSNAWTWEICCGVGGEVRGGTWMKRARFGVSTASVAPCVGARGGLCNYGGRWTSSSLWSPSLPGQVVSSVLPGSGPYADPPRATKTTGALLPWFGFFGCRLSDEGMHIPDWISQSFCTCKPTDCLVKVPPSKLIRGEGTRMSPPLGFNNLFLNQSLPWHTLRPTFRILLATKKMFI
jgi:hypothetical protein